MQKQKNGELNYLKEVREEMLMSRTELAQRAGISPLTVKRIELGFPSHPRTKRAILEALGISLEDRERVFPRTQEENDNGHKSNGHGSSELNHR